MFIQTILTLWHLQEGCGFKTTGERTQVFRLNRHKHGNVCLAGTGEIPLAGKICFTFDVNNSSWGGIIIWITSNLEFVTKLDSFADLFVVMFILAC